MRYGKKYTLLILRMWCVSYLIASGYLCGMLSKSILNPAAQQMQRKHIKPFAAESKDLIKKAESRKEQLDTIEEQKKSLEPRRHSNRTFKGKTRKPIKLPSAVKKAEQKSVGNILSEQEKERSRYGTLQ